MRWLVIVALVASVSAAHAGGTNGPASSYVIVVDRSLPADKLEMIDDAVVDVLAKADGDRQLAIVAAGASATVALGLTPSSNKRRIEAKLRAIESAPNGDLLAGIRAAGSLLSKVKTPVRHVLVVSDGDELLTVGPTVTKLRNAGITVSALGYQSLSRITLSDIARYGAGELFVATDRSSLVRSVEDDLVPPDEHELAVILVIDRSASMQGPKLEAAKETARVVAEILGPQDVIGVIAFDSEASIVVPAQHPVNRMRISSEIARIQGGGGTNVFPALMQASNMLRDVNAFSKHVIVLSDGGSPPDGLIELVETMRAANIMVSAVGLPGADRAQLSTIAEHGNGRLYMTDDIGGLPNLLLR